MIKKLKSLICLLLITILVTACGNTDVQTNTKEQYNDVISQSVLENNSSYTTQNSYYDSDFITTSINLAEIPAYEGKPYIVINNNEPFFGDIWGNYEAVDINATEAFEVYYDLDALGRPTGAFVNACEELQPTEERGTIGHIKPSGWHTAKYNGYIEGNYLYNRCHLIGYQLTGENANEQNLMTGTRYLNCDGMLPFEDKVYSYIDETDNHVLYRVTPIYDSDNLVASGVLMEAYSVEDAGAGVKFCVYCYNVQPGISIDYSTGESHMIEGYTGDYSTTTYFSTGEIKTYTTNDVVMEFESDTETVENEETTYVLNTNSMKFHKENCDSVAKIKDTNKVISNETREDIIGKGYEPCGWCNP